MKKVKYVAVMFGNVPDGTIIDAYKIANDFDDDGKVLLYHAPDKDDEYCCSSIELAIFDRNLKAYKSLRGDTYINLSKVDSKKFENLIDGEKKSKVVKNKKGKKR